ncbi:MAG: hypothetical protein K2J48_04600 [Muribaculaceae bacterium]|nr:hypothetical protein [Muribaculaceae bacterium]
MKKIISFLLIIAVLLPGSLFHDMILLMILLWIWRGEVKNWLDSKWKNAYRSLWIFAGCLTLILMPRPFALPTDRVQLVYFNNEGKRLKAPLHHWLLNIIFPEETICAIGSIVPLTPLRAALPLGESILKDFDTELRNGGLLKVGTAYRRNALALESPMSGTVPQGLNEYFGENTRAFYVIKPKNFDSKRNYPVLFFAHGYLGNWKLYTGLFRDIDNHIIVNFGTEDLSGIFNNRHIRELTALYLPILEEMGFNVDKNNISLMGLSNGGSAVDIAYGSNPDSFKNLIYVSTGVNNSRKTKAKIMVIGGGLDHCSPSMKRGMALLKQKGQKSAFLFDENHTHLKLLSDDKNCLNFLNEQLQ